LLKYAYGETEKKNVSQESQQCEAKLMQGCFIVHPKDSRNMSPHEISVGLQGDSPHIKDFNDIKRRLSKYSKRGINTIYINGICERAHNHFSPKSRVNISTRLGGLKGFEQLLEEAHSLKMKIIVDFSYRISSLKPDKRYLDQMCYVIEKERKLPFYGAPGRSMNADDSFIPNMRNYEAWRLFVDEIKEFVRITKVDGLLFDNSDSFPIYFKPNREELSRNDLNGNPTYSIDDKFYGNICDPCAYSSYD